MAGLSPLSLHFVGLRGDPMISDVLAKCRLVRYKFINPTEIGNLRTNSPDSNRSIFRTKRLLGKSHIEVFRHLQDILLMPVREADSGGDRVKKIPS